MMLATNALATATAALSYIVSPTRNSCVKRVAPSMFRYEPYGARVLAVEPAAPLSQMNVAIPPRSPAVPAKAPSVRYVVARFKHESATFIAPFRVTEGDLIVVEGDRGENIGTVESISKMVPPFAVERKILRRATEDDLAALSLQRQREAEAIRTAQAMAESLGLHANIEDVEYQFDMNKLTIFVRRGSKNGFVDFRKLQRGLFREFRCRIWCAYMDEVEAAEAGPRAK